MAKKRQQPKPPKPEYQFSNGSPFKSEFGQSTGEELQRLAEQHGDLSPDVVFQASKDPRSTLHKLCPTWDQQEAAERFWKAHARRVINSVMVRDVESGLWTRAFHSVRIEAVEYKTTNQGVREIVTTHKSYVSTEQVKINEDFASQVIQHAIRELKSWQRRYQEYIEVFGGEIFNAIDGAVEQAEKRATGPRAEKRTATRAAKTKA